MKKSTLRNIIKEEIKNQLSLFPRKDVSATAYRKREDNDNTREEKETQLMHVIDPKTDSAVKNMFGSNVKWSYREDPKRVTWQGVDKAGNGAWVKLRLEVTPTSGIGAGNPIDVYGYVPIAGKPPSDGEFAGIPLMGVGLAVNQGNKYKKNPLDTKQLEMFRDYVMSLSIGEIKKAMVGTFANAPKSFSELLSNNRHAKAMVDGLTGGDSEYGGYNWNQIVTQFYDDYKSKQNLLGKFRLKEDLNIEHD